MIGTVIPIPPSPMPWLPRSYIGSVKIDVAAVVAPSFDGNYFRFTDSILVDWELYVRPNVWEWSSNNYSLDWLIDPALSSVSRFGLPVIDGFYIELRRLVNERLWYIWIQPGGLPGSIYNFDTPPAPPDYWLPGSH